jgi:Maintenance of mitochondrial morphology protein 1
LRDVSIDSALGCSSVLNNVGKIEKFIVAQLRAFLDDYCVFPNYHVVYLETGSEDDSERGQAD